MAQFGAILERVPTAGAQWSTPVKVEPRRRSALSSLVSLLVFAAVAFGAWYGYQAWYLARAPLPGPVAQYVDGPGVAYTSPVTGIAGEFAGAPVETVLPGGASASVYETSDWSLVVAAFPATAAEQDVGAVIEAFAGGRPVRIGSARGAGSTFAAAVVGAEGRTSDALFERLTASLRLPGGASI